MSTALAVNFLDAEDFVGTAEEDARRFALNLRLIRKAKNLSRKELAARAGVRSEAGIRDLEQGLHLPGWEMVLRLSYALEVPIDRFAEEIEGELPKEKGGRPKKKTEDEE